MSDTIGNFPQVTNDCLGCGEPLQLVNAWMTDGCPCNTPLGVNNPNETRWRLLMELQQSGAKEVAKLKDEKSELLEALESIKKHQGLIGGNLAVMSATWTIANNAIKKAKGSDE